jgi:hypothetical protein
MTNQLVLLESCTARQDRLTDVNDDRALEAINKAKALLMASWNSTSIATTAQMAEYYEVSEKTVQTVARRNRKELTSDGLKTLKGKALQEVFNMNISEEGTVALTIWTPRAALRLGMLLRDSLVAQKVRTILLDVAEQQTSRTEFTQLATTVFQLVEKTKSQPALPKATVDPIPGEMVAMTERQCINRLVRSYVSRKNLNLPEGAKKETQQNITRWMYRELKIRYKFDVYTRFKNPNRNHKTKIDLIEAEGRLPQLHAICNHFLGQ